MTQRKSRTYTKREKAMRGQIRRAKRAKAGKARRGRPPRASRPVKSDALPFTVPDGYRGVSCREAVYAHRNVTLSGMGFLSYAEYLSSDLWWSIRRRVLLRASSCVMCQNAATQVHHVDYTRGNLTGADSHLMVPICRPCHKRIEFGDGGRKAHPWDVAFASGWFKPCGACARAVPRTMLRGVPPVCDPCARIHQ